mgnify:CR=1 FL=1
MKKNLMTLIILALVVVNLIMTAIMMFVTIPQTQKANAMIQKVCEAIDLELNSGAATGLSNLPVDRIETYDVASGESLTVNLKGGGYAVVGVSISVDKESETFAEKEGITYLSSKESIIKGSIIEIIGNYTKDELGESREDVKAELLKTLKKTFGADYVVGVDFTKFTMD